MGTWAGTITHESTTAASGSSLSMLKSNIACILLWQHGQYAVETEVTDAHPVSYDNNVGNKAWVLLIISLQEDAFAGVAM